MRRLVGLLPYVVAASVIAVGSTALVFSTVGADEVVSPAGTATSGRTPPPLSPTGRLAYWRQNTAGAFVLWASNLDGSQARPLTTLGSDSARPFGTRWTADGRAVAYTTDLGIGVIGLDGSRTDIRLPASVRADGFRVLDERWSPSGTRVAATVGRVIDDKFQVYFASLDAPQLTRAGDVGTFAGDWLNEDEVLVEAQSGVLGALRFGGTLRRLFDQPAASPIVDGGRVHFLQGTVVSNFSSLFVVNPTVWSIGFDGRDGRRESRFDAILRLDGRWPDGRYLGHLIGDQTQRIGSTHLDVLAPASLFRRAVVSADGRSAIGLGGPRIVRIDLTRGLTPSENAFVVLLDQIINADVWVKRPSAI